MNDNGRKTDSETIYADIINLPHHVSDKRAHRRRISYQYFARQKDRQNGEALDT